MGVGGSGGKNGEQPSESKVPGPGPIPASVILTFSRGARDIEDWRESVIERTMWWDERVKSDCSQRLVALYNTKRYTGLHRAGSTEPQA